MKFLCVADDVESCLFEGDGMSAVVPSEVVSHCDWLSWIASSVILHQSHYFLNHARLQGLIASQACLFWWAALRQTVGEVRMQPGLHTPITIHANQVLSGPKVAHDAVQFLKAIEGTQKHVQILGERDVFDVDESDWNAFDVDVSVVGGSAEIAAQFVVKVLSIDYAVLAFPPLEKLQVSLELSQALEVEQVLLQLLIGEVVDEQSEPSLFCPSKAIPAVSPTLVLEGGCFIEVRLAAAHIQNKCRAKQEQRRTNVAQGFIFKLQLFAIFLLPRMSSPSQLFSCVEADAILKSPVNNSPAKLSWSFSKDSRFKRSKLYCDSFYQIPGVKENKNRRAGFGYGKKTDLEFNRNPLHVVPPPDTYNLPTFVQTNRLHAKGFTPRFSREQIAPMSYIQLEPFKVPGPGRYQEFRKNESPKWSLHDRTSDLFPKTTVKIVPGPGTYVNQDAIELNPTGQYHLSQHLNSRAKVFNPPRSRRFNKSSTDVPGAGVYHPQNDLSNQGKYVLSQNVSAGKRKFLDGRRLSFTDIAARRSFTPGPGSYRAPSQFGQYDLTNQRTSSAAAERIQNSSSKTDRTKATEKH